ncbi:OmpA family protein [Sinorhizobium chiapasense]|uniref:OmpA family protein n=1 Tax=Sinorhizobium chiapasense TaxID=501572 RepID=A0ABZ2BD13_9HYPH
MSIRSRLFATVALPVFAATFAVQPALAESLMAPFEVAQEGAGEPSPEDLLLLKKRRKQAQESQGQAEEQQPQAEEQQAPRRKKRQQQAEEQQPAAEESAPRQAEEQPAPRRKKRQQQAEEQQPAAEESAPQQAEEQPAPRRKKRQQQAEEQQPAAKESAPQQAEEQPAPRRKKRQQQAEEQQPAAEEGAPQQAEEQPAPRRKKRQQQAEEQQPAAEEGVPQQAEEQQAPRKKRQQQAEEQQPAAEESAPQQAEEQQAPRKKRQQQAEEQQPAAEEGAPQQAEEQQAPRKKRQQQAEEQRQGDEPTLGVAPPATAEQETGEQPQARPAPEVVDKRTEEEKVKIAKDPAATDDTVVLPVENGAAVLDSDKDADNVGGNRAREARRKQREELRAKEESVAPPTDDAAAQAEISTEVREQLPQRIEANLKEEGQRIEEAPAFAVPQTTNIVNNTIVNNTVINNTTTEVTEVQVVEEVEDRVILGVGDRIFVRGDDRPRLRRDSQETYYDQLPRDRVRETIVRPGGYQIVTIYNRYGDIVQRSRIDRDGNEYLMIYAPEYDEDDNRPAIVDVGYDLPPMRLTIPVEDYIVDYADDPDRDYYEFLSEPPVEQVERVYTIDEVRNSARLRDKVRRIDLDTIHFETGSAEVSMSQAKTLRGVADAMSKVLEKDPGETFFIEGHTDAVGSDRDNLVLSDQRAESVAVLLSEVYGVPAENLVTQGYGERFLKVRTSEAEEENRRVTIRRVTPLVRPVAQR